MIGLALAVRSSGDSSSSQLLFSSSFGTVPSPPPGSPPLAGPAFSLIAFGPGGRIYAAGVESAGFFPTTANALQPDSPTVPHVSVNLRPGYVNFFAVIDPALPGTAQLVYSTYFSTGGVANIKGVVSDQIAGLAVDKAGRAYLCGTTSSAEFPTTSNALQRASPHGGAFLSVIDPNRSGRSQLVYSTYLGSGACYAANVDDRGLAYLSGNASSNSFPRTPNAFEQEDLRLLTGSGVPFVAIIDPSRSGRSSLVYSTLLGGGDLAPGSGDEASAIAAGPGGLVYVAGLAETTDFPVTPSAVQSHLVREPESGDPVNEFLSVLNPALPGSRQLVYSTYLGGKSTTGAFSVGVDASGMAYIFGGGATFTGTTDAFPTTRDAFQNSPAELPAPGQQTSFSTVSKIDPFAHGRASLLYSTIFGGLVGETGFIGYAGALGPEGLVYVTGLVSDFPQFPITADAFETASSPPMGPGGTGGTFLTILDPLAKGNASVVYSTYVDPSTIAVDAQGKACLLGTVTPAVNSYQPSGTTGVAILAPPIPSGIPTPPPLAAPTPTATHRPTPSRSASAIR